MEWLTSPTLLRRRGGRESRALPFERSFPHARKRDIVVPYNYILPPMRMTFAALEPEIALIRDASRRLVRGLGFMRPTLAGTDLPPSAVHALIEIGARKTMTATELCDALILEKSSVSRMVRKLVRAGEVAEGASSQDARAKPLSLTPQGLASLSRIDDFARRQVAEALERMGPETRRGLAESLASYARALQASRSGKPASAPRSRDG